MADDPSTREAFQSIDCHQTIKAAEQTHSRQPGAGVFNHQDLRNGSVPKLVVLVVVDITVGRYLPAFLRVPWGLRTV